MKVGVITIHYGCNYGSSAQAYALQRYLKTTFDFADVELINYIPKRYNKRRRYLSVKGNPIKSIIKNILTFPLKFSNNRKFELFQKKHLAITKKIYSYETLSRIGNKYDLAITGSDQVWNIDYNEGFDPAYYLRFCKCKKAAYAASAGRIDYTECEEKCFKSLILDIDFLSVRERELQIYLEQKLNRASALVVDPVFLLTKKEWSELEKRPNRLIPDKYVLVYCLDRDEHTLIPIANKIAKEIGAKTLIISYEHWWTRVEGVDLCIKNANVEEFLWLVNHSDFIVTNSFHGLSFSIIFEKQFAVVPRQKYNSRLENLISIYGLQKRVFCDQFDCKQMINFEDISKVKNEYINRSKLFIDSFMHG